MQFKSYGPHTHTRTHTHTHTHTHRNKTQPIALPGPLKVVGNLSVKLVKRRQTTGRCRLISVHVKSDVIQMLQTDDFDDVEDDVMCTASEFTTRSRDAPIERVHKTRF